MAAAYVELKKLTGKGILLAAARHNFREIQAELGGDGHIAPTKSHLNFCLAGPDGARLVSEHAEQLMREAGITRLRKDAVRAVEIMVSLPAASDINPVDFFQATLQWVRDYYSVPILSAIVHLDESAPHMHVLLLPLDAGHMVGSDLVGNQTKLRNLQASFFTVVAQHFGLSRPTSAERTSRAARYRAAQMALSHIQLRPECLSQRKVCEALTELISNNPEKLLALLGLAMPKGKPAKEKSFVEMMTRPCSPEPSVNPIGFQKHTSVRKKANPISV